MMAGSQVKRQEKRSRLQVSSVKNGKKATTEKKAGKGKKVTKSKCDVCMKIMSVLDRADDENFDVDLGSFESVMNSTACKVHPQMLRFYLPKTAHYGGPIVNFSIHRAPSIHGTGIRRHHIKGVAYATFGLELLPVPCSNGPSRRGKIVNPRWIEKSVFRRWKHYCNSHQNRDCLKGPVTTHLVSIRPTWLIDTWRLCLIRGDNGAPYVALSYVWGRIELFKASKENIDQLQEHSALADSHKRLGVPMTIANAISVVDLLGERYLWVDALCIVQDDETMKYDQIQNMASIFANASITIIAKDGEDANYGLRGLMGISPPRDFSQDIFTIRKGFTIIRDGRSHLFPDPWSQRAWTFQEDLFSPRTLTFHKGSVRWDCACSTYTETRKTDGTAERDTLLTQKDPSWFSTPFPDFFAYANLVYGYNGRKLSFPEDAMAAFSGITTALSQSFYGGFICCLPVLFLDVALCWQPIFWCKKRLPFSAPVLNKRRLPSWSWVGWEGRIERNNWFGTLGYLKNSKTIRVRPSYRRSVPIVQWYSRECVGSEPQPVEAPRHAQELKESSLRSGGGLPIGWSRFYYVSSPIDQGETRPDPTSPTYFYKHELDPNTEFWYPIPICSSQQPQRYSYDSLLSCFTQRTFVCLAEKFSGEGISTYNSCFSIRDDQGRWLGALQPNEELYPPSQEPKSKKRGSWLSCELVTISRGYVHEGCDVWDMDEWKHDERPRAGGWGSKYEFYNVLWVEWVEGIAYRKGLGRIEKSAWEDQELEQIELILG